MIEFSRWLATTPLSQDIQMNLWSVPTIQTIHILAIAMVLSSVAMITLRIVGLAGGTQTMTQTSRRFIPWFWGGLVVLAITGTLLVIGEPVRSLNNTAFWLKMVLIAILLAVVIGFQITLHRKVAVWEEAVASRRRVKALAVL